MPIRRQGSSVDVRRLGAAVSFPGIDPRSWVSLAVVTAVNLDAKSGPMIDATLLPSLTPITARVGAEGAVGGCGVWWPITVDDEVLVGVPEGESAHGPVVLRRLWSQADPPPALAVANPLDVLIQAPKGRTLRVVCSGGGEVLLQTDGKATVDSPDVRLGGEAASHALIFGDDFGSAEGAFGTLLASIASALGTITSGAPAGGTPAASAITAAATAYRMAVQSVLSTKVRTA